VTELLQNITSKRNSAKYIQNIILCDDYWLPLPVGSLIALT